MPHAAWPLWPLGNVGEPTNDAPGDLPVRRPQVGQVPRRRDVRGEVRVVGQDRAAGAGARRREGPGVRRAGAADEVAQRREVLRQPIERRPGKAAGRHRRRQPVGVRPMQRERAASGPSASRMASRPTSASQLPARDSDWRPPRRGRRRPPRRLRPARSSTSSCGRGPVAAAALMPATYAPTIATMSASSADTWRSATRRNPRVRVSRSTGSAGAPEDLGQRAAAGAEAQLELERAVLAVAEPEPEPCVGVVRSGHMGDAPPVARQGDRCREPGHAHLAARSRQSAAEQAKRGSQAWPIGHPPHDATVYSAA